MTAAEIIAFLAGLAFMMLAIGGYIANIFAIVASDFGDFTVLLALRLIGVVLPILGAILGFV